jgi:hypothetical protein
MTRSKVLGRICCVIAVQFIVLVLAGCLTKRETPGCKKRNADVDARVQVLELALAKVPVGATKEDVVRFFAVVGMAPYFSQPWKDGTSSATGTEYTKGCPPYIFCGDTTIIQVIVVFDKARRVSSHRVSSGYIDCL